MFPSDCVLERLVRTDGDEDLAATSLPLFILRCEDWKAEGYAEDTLEIYNHERVKDMKIGVHLADTPPAVSYLAILGLGARGLLAQIVAVDESVIVIRLDFIRGGGPGSYLIYDAVALSLRMIPAPRDPSWGYTLSSDVSVARPSRGSDYALVHTGRLFGDAVDSVFLWRPSSSSPPWSDFKKAGLLETKGWRQTNTQFSFKGHAYWVDLLCGAFCFSCDALFDDNSSSVLKFIPLPVDPSGFDHDIAERAAYKTMGVVRDSFIRLVSIDGFQGYVPLKDRTVTVWKLLGHDKRWDKELDFSLEMLWSFKGFGDLPKDLTPMYPFLSTNDPDIIYLGLGDYRETKIVRGSLPPKWEFFPYSPLYMLAVDMRKKMVRTILSVDPNTWFRGLISCSFSWYLHKALVGPCDMKESPSPRRGLAAAEMLEACIAKLQTA